MQKLYLLEIGADVEERLLVVLIQLSVIILTARLFANIFRRLRQPMAVGEIFAGVVLGPSVLGWLLPEISARIFLPESTPLGHDTAQVLHVLSQLGLIFLLFLVGMEFDFSHLKTNVRNKNETRSDNHNSCSIGRCGRLDPSGYSHSTCSSQFSSRSNNLDGYGDNRICTSDDICSKTLSVAVGSFCDE